MARNDKLAAPDGRRRTRISAASWAALATVAGTALLLYTGITTGEWRGVVVTEVQILVVGAATWAVLRD